MLLYIQYPTWISPQVVSFLPVRWYGIMYVLGYVTTYFFIITQIDKDKNNYLKEHILNIIMWAFLCMIICARLASELIYNKNFVVLIKPWLLFWPFQNGQFVGIQGMSYHGGLVGIILAVFIYCKKYRLSFSQLGDIAVIGAALGYTFGRLGNFINGELYGRITSVPWGMLFPQAELLPASNPHVKKIVENIGLAVNEVGLVNVPRHPSQLYEALFEGLVTGLLLWALYRIVKRVRKYVPGTMISMYVVFYGMSRFIIEYFRQPDTGLDFVIRLSSKPNPNWLLLTPFNFTTGQILSAIMVLIGIVFTVYLCVRDSHPSSHHTISINNGTFAQKTTKHSR